MRQSMAIAMASVVVIASGCATLGPALIATGAIPDGYQYDGVWGTQGFPAGEAEVRQAVLDGMGDLKMRGANQAHTKGGAPALVLDGQAEDGRHARITVRPAGMGSLVSVRIGRFGDEALSKALMDRVGVRLGTRPVELAPAEPPTSGPPLGRFFSRDAIDDATMLGDQVGSEYRDSVSP